MAETTEINVSYSVGLKVNLDNYESADFHLSESHRIDVSDMAQPDILHLAQVTRDTIAKRLGEEVVARGMAAKNDRDF